VSRAKKSGSNNLIGCLLGCGVITIVLLLLIVGGVFYTFRFGSMAASPKADTTALLATGAAMTLRVDLEAPTALSLAQLEDTNSPQVGGLMRMFRPYEGSLSFSVSPDGREVYAGVAVSAPRGTSFFVNMLENARRDIEKNGRTITQIGVDPERPGVLSVRMLMPSPAEAPGLRGEAWPSPTPGVAPTLDSNNFVSFVMDNRNGDAGLVGAAVAQSVGEDAGYADFSAPDASTVPALSLLSQVRLIKGSRLVSTLKATADFTPQGDLLVEVGLDATNEVSAMLLMSSLGGLPEQLAKEWESSGLKVTGSFERSGAHIAGTLNFVGAIAEMRRFMKDYNERGGIAGYEDGDVFQRLDSLTPAQP